MLPNTGKLAGCTLFITGASRGIGKVIALKAAKDGANVVIAAKTGVPHRTLPGTIYTAAEEIEAAGGKALPCIVNVREEDQIADAVVLAVQKFGGIDVLVNNASAISLTGTLETPTKKVDLMMSANTRGTYLTSKLCLPYLRKSKIGHILNISPPINLNPIWFKNHCAYTISKYGMSMCVLGMAEEFRGEVAVNALWPQTGYPLIPDFFLDVDSDTIAMKMETQGASPTFKEEKKPDIVKNEVPDKTKAEGPDRDKPHVHFAAEKPAGPVAETFKLIKVMINEDIVKTTQGVYQFELSGEEGGTWYIDLKNKGGSAGIGEPPGKVDVIMNMSGSDFVKMFSGKLKPTMAFMSGKLTIRGDVGLAIRLEKLMAQFNAKL
ncbi:hydroxysteroid dehydrogenase-like protein 2 isoform X2 [Protobothrops mucrosquamatus]|uniref:hydroxysteroid dehydrogenase-like protein 2 isoform X2 n=1 Tax=Protobothrops mucrosquamatus TaxID=103944 RepID=UPI000775FB50|nr:hydroxysteroid dehydrogenase-like protein 2 isoform X2 [Protobothrops mucrosquamatus]